MATYSDTVTSPPLQPVPGFDGLFLRPGSLQAIRDLESAAKGDGDDTDDTDDSDGIRALLLVLFKNFLCDADGQIFDDMQTAEDMNRVEAPVQLLRTASAMIKGDDAEAPAQGN